VRASDIALCTEITSFREEVEAYWKLRQRAENTETKVSKTNKSAALTDGNVLQCFFQKDKACFNFKHLKKKDVFKLIFSELKHLENVVVCEMFKLMKYFALQRLQVCGMFRAKFHVLTLALAVQ